jgi:FlaG/FlaF family flagellin (archaellin)
MESTLFTFEASEARKISIENSISVANFLTNLDGLIRMKALHGEVNLDVNWPTSFTNQDRHFISNSLTGAGYLVSFSFNEDSYPQFLKIRW